MMLSQIAFKRNSNPVDLIEQVATFNNWSFERPGDDEIAITVKGVWTDYNVSISWMADFEALHLACGFDLKIPKLRIREGRKLLSLINERLLIGHFDIWEKNKIIMFRQTLPLNGGVDPTNQQLEYLLSTALEACERYYQAFQFVVWAGYDAQKALDGAVFETFGNA